MGIETTIKCDVCEKEVGKEGTGSSGEYIQCNTRTPSGLHNLVCRTKTEWVVCGGCWGTMWWRVKEDEDLAVATNLIIDNQLPGSIQVVHHYPPPMPRDTKSGDDLFGKGE